MTRNSETHELSEGQLTALNAGHPVLITRPDNNQLRIEPPNTD